MRVGRRGGKFSLGVEIQQVARSRWVFKRDKQPLASLFVCGDGEVWSAVSYPQEFQGVHLRLGTFTNDERNDYPGTQLTPP